MRKKELDADIKQLRQDLNKVYCTQHPSHRISYPGYRRGLVHDLQIKASDQAIAFEHAIMVLSGTIDVAAEALGEMETLPDGSRRPTVEFEIKFDRFLNPHNDTPKGDV